MGRSDSPLFWHKRFSEYRREQFAQMEDEISTLSSDELNENSTDSLTLIFSSKYTPSPLQLHDIIKKDGGEVEKKISNRRSIPTPGPGTPTRKYQRLKVKLQFDGERDLFRYRPTPYNHNPPVYHELNRNEVVYYVDYDSQNQDAEEIREEVQSEIDDWREDVESLDVRCSSGVGTLREFRHQATESGY